MVDFLIDVAIKVIQVMKSLLGLTYDPGSEPLLAIVVDVGIQAISSYIERSRV